MNMNTSTNPLAARGLKPVADLAATRGHGDRLSYMAGCRCFHCRSANTAYEADRKVARAAGDWNGNVSAEKARAHLKMLSTQGVGRRSVAAASDVADTVLQLVISGRKTSIRARTERAILAVTKDAAGDRALVPAKDTWQLLNRLIKDGFTKSYLAQRLGGKTRALQLKKDFVTVRSAYRVQCLYNELQSTCAKSTTRLLKKLQDEGYTVHQVDQRLADLARSLGEEPPPLEVKNGRVRARAAALVEQLYVQLTT